MPEGYCADNEFAWSGPPELYDPNLHLAVHYLDGGAADPSCADTTKVTPQEIDRAGMPPEGRKG